MMRYSTTFVNEKMSFERVYKYQIISASQVLSQPTNISAVTRFENVYTSCQTFVFALGRSKFKSFAFASPDQPPSKIILTALDPAEWQYYRTHRDSRAIPHAWY